MLDASWSEAEIPAFRTEDAGKNKEAIDFISSIQ